VMNAVQAARVQAQQAGYLRSTPQQRVIDNGGLIEIVPVNPNVVYVPYYNPWRIYGGWVSPYAGFYVAPPPVGLAVGLGLGFAAVGISIGLFAHYGWGFHSWSPGWRRGVVVYNHNTYISNSPTVFNHGHFGAYNRGAFEHAGPGVPANFHPAATRAGFARGPVGERPGAGFNRPAPAAARPAGGAFTERPLAHSPAAAARAQAPRPQAARPQVERPAARPEGGRPAAAGRPAGVGRPEGRPAPAAHAAPQGHAAQPHGRPEGGHEHK